ncbi:MAG: tetratricopeptide repeat protein [Sedimentisphaerales bacterium]|nr:tetratricopeptide repeat protein [Sedimentisphaerales bacterium]
MSSKRRRRPPRPAAGTKPQDRPRNRGPVRGVRLWLFRLLAVVGLPLAVLCLLELALRVVGYGYSPRVTVPCKVNGVAHRGDNLYFSRRFFPTMLAREFEPFVFPTRKAPGTYRIFVLGASAAQGVPNHAFRFGRILEAMLQERFADAHFEVVTAAMAAINSHVVVEVARECARYEPDLFVVYLGNNEVVGPYGPGTVLTPALSNLHLIRMGIAARRTRIGQLVSSLAQMRGLPGGGPKYWQGMEMFVGQQVRADDPRLNVVYKHFRRNLEDICHAASGAGAQTVLCTVGTNLRDCPPFASSHKPELTTEQQSRWDQLYQQGVQYEAEGEYARAIQSYLDAAGLDDSYAELQFRLGHCHWQLGEYEKAAEDFTRARDIDVLRFRADTRVNEVVHAVAAQRREQGVHLADVAGALAAESPHGLPGEELFHEHVHMTFEGNYVVARTVFDRVELMLSERLKATRQGESPTLQRCAARLMYTDWSRHQSLDIVVTMFLAKPPFTGQLYHEEHVAVLEQKVKELKKRLSPDALRAIAEQYRAAIAQAPNDWRLHWDYGKLLAEDLKQYDAALAEYQTVVQLLPHSYTGYNSLGAVLRAKGDLRAAMTEYGKVLRMKPTAGDAHYHLGWCFQQQGRSDDACSHYRQAIRFTPDCVPAYLGLGELLFKGGKLKEALDVCRAGVAIVPKNPLLHSNIGVALIKMGQRQEGAQEIRTALQLDPNSPQIRRVAETLLGPQAIH